MDMDGKFCIHGKPVTVSCELTGYWDRDQLWLCHLRGDWL